MDSTTEEQLTAVITSLIDEQDLELTSTLEVIANVLIREGLSFIPDEDLPDEVTQENLMDLVLTLKEKYGENLPMATIHQGLVMLMWLENLE